MPRIKSNTPTRKMTITRRPILIVIIILIIAIVALILAKILTNNAADGDDQSDATTSETTTRTKALGTSTESNSTDPEDNDPQTPKQYEGKNANTYDNLTGAITYTEVEGENLYIGTNIDQFLSSGTCTLTLTKDDKTITKTTDIIADPTTSSCDGFTISITELGSGTWDINLKIAANGKQGTITGKATI